MNYINNFKFLPWHLKFFVLLILLRPIIDCFYWVKDTNPFLSPMYWTGVLPVVLIPFYFFKTKYDGLKTNGLKLFLVFSVLILMNSIGIIVNGFSSPNFTIVQSFALSIKLISFPLFFLFLSTQIEEVKLDFVLKTFLISTLFPFVMITYELLIGPINAYTPGGREFERYRGLYPDGINYTIYWMIGLITSAYFYIKNNTKSNLTFYFPLLARLAFGGLLFTFILISISLFFLNQAVAYFIFSFLFAAILVFVFKKNKKHFLTLTFALTIIIIIIYVPGFSKISTLFQVDKEVIEGKLDFVHGANGRVWIWVEALNRMKELPAHTWFFGTGLSKSDGFNYMTGGAHNDYLRILYSTGGIGLLLYLLFLASLFKGFRKLSYGYKFLLISTTGSLLLFSVTHTPTFYIPFVYFLTTVLAYSYKNNYEF